MDKITKSLLESFVELNELESLDEYVQFEHFVNFSIISKLNRGSFEIDDIHTGSGGDSSIDGLCIFANGRVITDQDELYDLIQDTKYLDADITFIQAKTSSSFDGSAIGSFIHGVKDFLSDEPKLVQNKQIQKKKEIL